jgi:hypothetical protein
MNEFHKKISLIIVIEKKVTTGVYYLKNQKKNRKRTYFEAQHIFAKFFHYTKFKKLFIRINYAFSHQKKIEKKNNTHLLVEIAATCE